MAACLHAHEDKAPAKRAAAIYNRTIALQITIETFGNCVRSCRPGLLKLCGTVKPGEVRLNERLVQTTDLLASLCRKVLEPAKPELAKLVIAR
jgi:hypothetical protein